MEKKVANSENIPMPRKAKKPEDAPTIYDQSEEYEALFKAIKSEFFDKLNLLRIPFFFSAAVANDEGETKYFIETRPPKAMRMNLTTDHFPDYLNVSNGFKTVLNEDTYIQSLRAMTKANLEQENGAPSSFYSKELLDKFNNKYNVDITEDNEDDDETFDVNQYAMECMDEGLKKQSKNDALMTEILKETEEKKKQQGQKKTEEKTAEEDSFAHAMNVPEESDELNNNKNADKELKKWMAYVRKRNAQLKADDIKEPTITSATKFNTKHAKEQSQKKSWAEVYAEIKEQHKNITAGNPDDLVDDEFDNPKEEK